jgi:F-type H+-transporting ATPase subunit a
MSANPLEQFTINKLLDINIENVDISFTNSSLFMSLALISIVVFFAMGLVNRSLVPGNVQSMCEMVHNFIKKTVDETIGADESEKFFPLIFSIFLFVLIANILGMLPFGFTITSHIAVTAALAFLVFSLVTIYGFYKHGLKFFGLFFHKDAPLVFGVIIFILELFAFFVRPISLSIRLMANMVAGHVLLAVISSFIVMMGYWGVFPLIFTLAINAFELFVGVLQAYIFTILTCVYLSDAVKLH